MKGGSLPLTDWWNSIPAFEKIFWYFALPFSAVFIFQFILTFFGLDSHGNSGDLHDGSVDGNFGDTHSSEFQSGFMLFTLHNIVVFFTVFGWAGIFGANAGLPKLVTSVLAFCIGFVVMVMVAGLYYMMSRLTETGNTNLSNAINAVGTAYLPIPTNRSGIGQIQVSIQGSVREVEAMTDEDLIPTGTPVRVIGMVNDQILLVKKEG
jgi:hypothetical protein